MPIGDDQEVLDLGGPVAPARPRWPVLAVALVLAALVALVVLPAADDDADVALEETTTTSSPEGRSVPDAGSFPAPMALGAPTDGKDSIGLPVKAEPAAGLVDGQEVTVTGTGFPPDVSVGVVMCAREAGREHGAQGVAACNIGHFSQVQSDADGVATATFAVRRLLPLGDVEVDCASEPGRCMVAMGMISDYDTSGGHLVDFDPSVPLPDPPAVAVEPSAGLRDGEEVLVRASGLVPGSSVSTAVCDAEQVYCWESGSRPARVDADGSATLRTRVWRAFPSPAWDATRATPNVDCAAEACQLVVWGEADGGRMVPPVPLAFAPGPLLRAPVPVEVRTSGPYRPGDVIEVVVGPLPADSGAELVLCGAQTCGGGMTAMEREGDRLRVRLTVPTEADGLPCAGDCRLIVNVHAAPPDGGPPVLLPDPIPVVVEPGSPG